MKKTQKISVINAFFNDNTVLDILEYGEITEKKIAILSKRVNNEDIKATYIDAVHKAVATIANAVKNWEEVYKMVTPETWIYYMMMDFDNLEMDARKAAFKQLKTSWRALPKYRKADHVKAKTTR